MFGDVLGWAISAHFGLLFRNTTCIALFRKVIGIIRTIFVILLRYFATFFSLLCNICAFSSCCCVISNLLLYFAILCFRNCIAFKFTIAPDPYCDYGLFYVRRPFVRRQSVWVLTFSTSSISKTLGRFWWSFVGMKYPWSRKRVVVSGLLSSAGLKTCLLLWETSSDWIPTIKKNPNAQMI